MDLDDLPAALILIVVTIGALIYDWPRALAGLAVGVVTRRTRRRFVNTALGALGVAVAGEAVYRVMGRSGAMTVPSFGIGLFVAAVCAFGVLRFLLRLSEAE